MTKPVFTKAQCLAMEDTFNKKYASHRGTRRFSIASESRPNGIFVTVTLSNDDCSFHYPVEGWAPPTPTWEEALKRANSTLDYIDLYFNEYLVHDNETTLPIDWTPYEYEGETIHLRGQILNLKLERLADLILERGSATEH